MSEPRGRLEVENVSCGYGSRQVLHDVSVSVAPGEVVSVIGANGVGKSTLLNAVAGIVPVRSGRIALEGRDITTSSAPERVRSGVVMCPEGRQLFPGLTVRENLVIGAVGAKAGRSVTEERWSAAVELFPVIGERADQDAGTLSGGEQQMVAIGRALMAAPRFLVLDEPTLGLSPLMVEAVMGAVERIAATGTPVLLAEQNLHASLAISDRGYVVESGRVVRSGSGAELLADTAVAEAYLGIDADLESQ